MNWAYIAGFFDGEGSVGLGAHSSGRKATAYISQSGKVGLKTLEEIKGFMLQEGIRCTVIETGKTQKHKKTMPSYRLCLSSYASVVDFLTCMFPYLRIKKVVAQDVIRYNKIFPNIFKSSMSAAWRKEKQSACMPRGDAWHKRYDGRTGRTKGSKDKQSRRSGARGPAGEVCVAVFGRSES